MIPLRDIYTLLVEEYRISRHIIWTDELSARTINDVTEILHLLVKASQGCQYPVHSVTLLCLTPLLF
jgi:hypothetical protein